MRRLLNRIDSYGLLVFLAGMVAGALLVCALLAFRISQTIPDGYQLPTLPEQTEAW